MGCMPRQNAASVSEAVSRVIMRLSFQLPRRVRPPRKGDKDLITEAFQSVLRFVRRGFPMRGSPSFRAA